jgi:hypothetical protein
MAAVHSALTRCAAAGAFAGLVAGLVFVSAPVPDGLWLVAAMVVAAVAVACAAWWHGVRPDELRLSRFVRGQCERCGYDLRGNVSGVCPECGEANA